MVFLFKDLNWRNAERIESKDFDCWNCGNKIASNYGYFSYDVNQRLSKSKIYICHKCGSPNVYDMVGNPIISKKPGKFICKLPDDIKTVYEEARSCLSVEAYTGAIMLFRKIIMNMAVEEGAEENKNFKHYIDYLCDNGYVHKKQVKQADTIRELGNSANHQIECRTKDEAESMLKFIEFLLLNNYEFADEEGEE